MSRLQTKRGSTNALTTLDDVSHFFDYFFNPISNSVFNDLQPTGSRYPKVDVQEGDSDYVVKIAAAGFNKEDLDIELSDSVLIISGAKKQEQQSEDSKRRYLRREIASRSFRRAIRFPDDLDVSNITSSYEDGIIQLVIGKKTINDGKVKITLN